MADRRGVDRLLDEMDDVIADWEGSRDSARWTADTGWNPGTVAFPDPCAVTEGLRRQFEPLLRATERALAGLAEYFQTPEYKAFLAAAASLEREEEQTCHCLCGARHPGEARCLGLVLASEVCTVPYGAVEVPMCAPCARKESSDA